MAIKLISIHSTTHRAYEAKLLQEWGANDRRMRPLITQRASTRAAARSMSQLPRARADSPDSGRMGPRTN
jgi:hypothetical protein